MLFLVSTTYSPDKIYALERCEAIIISVSWIPSITHTEYRCLSKKVGIAGGDLHIVDVGRRSVGEVVPHFPLSSCGTVPGPLVSSKDGIKS